MGEDAPASRSTPLIDAALRQAAAALSEAGIASARVDAQALLAFVLRVSPREMLRRSLLGERLGKVESATYGDIVAERAQRIPLQYLTGFAWFAGVRLAVGPGVFVPRPETELLVARAVQWAADLPSPLVVDLCSGSGAVALAIKHQMPAAQVHAIEASAHAHAWAQQNVSTTGIRVELTHGDALVAGSEFDGMVDVVTCNPPYIPVDAQPIDPEVRDHDPEMALYGGSADGLAIPLAMAVRSAQLLRPGGVLLMEHGETQARMITQALRSTGAWVSVCQHRDMTDRPRAVEATRSPGLEPGENEDQ